MHESMLVGLSPDRMITFTGKGAFQVNECHIYSHGNGFTG